MVRKESYHGGNLHGIGKKMGNFPGFPTKRNIVIYTGNLSSMAIRLTSLTDIRLIYGVANSNACRSLWLCLIFIAIDRRIGETGSRIPTVANRERKKADRIADAEERVLNRVTSQPSLARGKIARE